MTDTACPPLRQTIARNPAFLNLNVATIAWYALGAGVLLAVSIPYRNLILYHFYVRGAFLFDEGIFAGILWHQGPWLPPTPINFTPRISFFEIHIQPLFVALDGISWLLPLSMVGFFAWIIGIGHALPALGIFLVLSEGFALKSIRQMLIAAALAVVFGFNGLALAIARFPHPEIIIAGGLVLFLACLALEMRRAALAWFLVTLLTREDAGFHLAGILLLLVAAEKLRGAGFAGQRGLLIYAASGFAYSLVSVIIQHRYFPTHYSPMVRIYLGTPAFHHLSAGLVALRLVGLPLFRPYLALPAILAVVWALVARNLTIVVGYLAFLPWLLLQVCADSNIAGTLSGYYAFPFLVSAAWPVIAVVYQARRAGDVPSRRALPLFALMLALSFTGLSGQWNNGLETDLRLAFTTEPSSQLQDRTESALRELSRLNRLPGRPALGVLRIDLSVAALSPYGFDKADLFDPGNANPFGDMLVYVETGLQGIALEAAVAKSPLRYRGKIIGTHLCLASRRPLDMLSEPALKNESGGCS